MEIKELVTNDWVKEAGRTYEVPIYQREYAWTETEITKMMADVWDAFNKDPRRNYYFGTLVVRQPENDGQTLEVIDGQQRLTTFMLLSKMLWPDLKKFRLRFSNRPDANEYVREYYNGNDKLDKPESFATARECLRNFRPSLEDGTQHDKSLATGLAEEKKEGISFKEFIQTRVVFFEVAMPPDTDAMAYFEVMNNRGEQLQYHELLKAELLTKLHDLCTREYGDEAEEVFDVQSARFNLFWTACSKMDGHLIDHLHACIELEEDMSKQWQDIEIEKYKDKRDESGVPQEGQSVIRDFSVFLMHVLKIYVQEIGQDASNIPLDERLMQKTYESVDVDPYAFLRVLIQTRLCFDKYVVKAKMLEGEVEDWQLQKIVRYTQPKQKSASYKEKNTFADKEVCNQIIAIESALQVSNADQRHKEWLHAILAADESVRSSPKSLIALLHHFAADRITEAKKRAEDADRRFYGQGLNTPRLVLNVIDYLMWLKFKSRSADENDETVFRVPDTFVFKYLNSVEHHHPQHDDQTKPWGEQEIDDIGNLFLISSRENSSMSNRSPLEKKNRYTSNHGGNLPDNPKRCWMYNHTFDESGWSLDDMKRLSTYVQKLLEEFCRNSLNCA